MKKHFLLALLTMLPFLGAWAGDVGTFAELKEALAAGGDVKLTAGIEVTEVLKVDKAVTLDLNGQTITVPEGLVEPIEEPFIVKRGGTFTVNDNIGGGKIDASNATCAIKLTDKGEAATGDLAELVVNGGTIIGDEYAITGNGTRHDTKVTIAGGTLQATTGIYNPQIGDLVINGGVIEGFDAAVEVRSGNLTVTGGSFKCTNNQLQAVDCEANGNGTTTKGAALAIVQHVTKNPINVSISGGEFDGVSALFIKDVNNNEEANVTVSVTGGTFKGLVEASGNNLVSDHFISGGKFQESNGYQSEGFSWVMNPDEWWTVTGYDVVIQLGTINVPYGDEIRDFTINDFSYSGSKSYETGDFTPSDFTKAELFAAMTFVRVDQGNNAGEHAYTVEIDDAFNAAHPAINTVNVNNGYVNFIPRSLADALVTFEPNPIPDQAYTGDQIKPEVKVLFNGTKLVENTDYTVTLGENILPATGGTITFNGINNFTEQVTLPFNIIGTNIADNVIVQVSGTYTYNGEQQKPVADDIKVYQKGDDGEPTGEPLAFTIKEDGYGTNVNAGPGSVTVTLGGIYSGDAVGTFTIDPKSIADDDFTVEGISNAYYDGGTAIERNIVLKDGEKTLEKGADKDFTVAYINNVNAGTATVTITGVNNYKDTQTRTFTIYKRYFGQENNFDWTAIEAVIEAANKVYNGEAQTIDFGEAVPVLISNGKRYPLTSEDYTISYKDNTNAGTATVIFTGADPNYLSESTATMVATKEFTFQIAQKPVTIAAVDFASPYAADIVIPEPEITTAEGLEVTDAEKEAILESLTYQYRNGNRWSVLTANTSLTEGEYDYRPVLGQNVDQNNYAYEIVAGKLTIATTEFIAKVLDAEMNFAGRLPDFVIENVSPVPNSFTSWREIYAGLVGVAFEVFEKNADGEYVVATQPYQVGKDYIVKAGKIVDGEFVAGGLASGSFIISVNPGKLTVNPVSVQRTDRVTVSNIPACDYTGEQIKPVVTVRNRNLGADMAEGVDYDITYGENLNAGTGSVTITGKGNYNGTRTVNFTIRKITLDVVADNMVDENAQSYSDVLNNRVEYTWSLDKEDLVAADKEKSAEELGMTGTVTVTYNDAAVSVGTHTGALRIRGNNVSFTNYVPNFVNGDIEIKEGKITLAIKGEYEITYGDTFDPETVEWAYKEGDLSEAQQENLTRIISGVTFKVADDVPTVAIGDEAKTYEAGEYPEGIIGEATSTNYAITVLPAKLIVNKKPIVVTACDQNVDQGKAPVLDVYYEETEDHIQTVSIPEDALVGDDELVLALECTATAVGENADAIKVKFDAEAKPNCNYEITTVSGTLTVAGAEFIVLARAAEWDNSALLADYDGQVTTVKIKGDELKKSWWYTLTLPFATTVADISAAFGYAAVDVPDLSNSDPKKVAFVLKVDDEIIPANTLLLIKIHKDRDLDDKPAVFELTEETPIEYNPESYVEDAAHNKYYTLYQNKALDPAENATCWYLYEDATQNPKYNMFYRAGARSSAWNVASFGGYFEAASAEPDAVRVYVQEEDGTITAINAMEINPQAAGEGWYTIDGMKLNAAPTQKGVYINNGKKVVVK